MSKWLYSVVVWLQLQHMYFLFPASCGKKKSGLTMELARVAGRETRDTWLDGRFGEDGVNKLLEELDITELDSELCAYLDNTIEHDENLQFLRLSADYCGRPSWKVIKYRCQLANESESFYRCISVQDQWLHTLIQPQQQKPDVMEIRSNVVPRQAYLTRLAGMNITCPGHELCMGGFFPISVLREAEPYRQSCTKCALAEQLRGGAHIDAGLVKLWEIAKVDENLVADHARIGGGNEGEVYKIEWRKGIFARKEFKCATHDEKNCEIPPQNGNFDMEFQVAKAVSHPNIVHCFGCSLRANFVKGYNTLSLFMELLEEDLETRLQEPIQKRDPFYFRDSLDVLWQVAEAMKHLHEKNFVHGDLKPDNILLSRLPMPHSESGKFYLVKVSDFGCAQRVGSSGAAVKDFNSKIGTLKYTAPEVLRCRCKNELPPKHPQKIDVYSFGVVAYQVLTRVTKEEVYRDVRASEIIKGVIKDQHPLRPDLGLNLRSLNPDRRSLLPLIQSCWHPNPEARPSFPQICEELHRRSIEHGQHGEQERNAIFHCIGDVLAKLLKATMVGVTVGGCIHWFLRKRYSSKPRVRTTSLVTIEC